MQVEDCHLFEKLGTIYDIIPSVLFFLSWAKDNSTVPLHNIRALGFFHTDANKDFNLANWKLLLPALLLLPFLLFLLYPW